jgi:hypothetical protein
MTGEFPDFDSLPEPEAEPLTEDQIRECLRIGAANAREAAKLIREAEDRAIDAGLMNLVLR